MSTSRTTQTLSTEQKPTVFPWIRLSELPQFNIMRFMDDTDLANLFVIRSLTTNIQRENRWKTRLKDMLFRGLYQQRLLNNIAEGKSIVMTAKDEKTSEEPTLADRVNADINQLFAECNMRWKITNYRSIYARAKKLDNNLLNEDEFILLSGNVPATRDWLERNFQRVKRQEFLDLKGLCPVHYISLTGDVNVMRLYQTFGDVSVTTLGAGGAELFAAMSGNVNAMLLCSAEYHRDMQRKNYFGWSIEHGAALSGNAAALRACKDIFKIKKRTETQEKLLLDHVARYGSENMMYYCVDHLGFPMTQNILYRAARAGNTAIIEAGAALDVKFKFVSDDGTTLLHAAALSGKVSTFLACKKYMSFADAFINFNSSVPITYCAALSGNLNMLRFWQEQIAKMTEPFNVEGVGGEQGIFHVVAEKGGPAEMKFCHDMGFNITPPQWNGANILHIAARNGNSALLRDHENTGADIHAVDDEKLGVLYHAAVSNDPFTLLSCIESGLDMKDITDDSFENFIKDDVSAAMLILLKVLNIPIHNALSDLGSDSTNKVTQIAASLLMFDTLGPMQPVLAAEWNKNLAFANMADRLSHFFENVLHLRMPGAALFSRPFIRKTKNQKFLARLSENLTSMQDKNMVDLYVYLVYSLIRGVTSNMVSFEDGIILCAAFAGIQVLQEIYANKAALEANAMSRMSNSSV